MTSIQIKNVPEETHAVLRRRAAASNQSLQEYLLSKLVHDAATPTVAEILDRVSSRSGGALSLDEASLAVEAERARR